jgi:hypothetical protein
MMLRVIFLASAVLMWASYVVLIWIAPIFLVAVMSMLLYFANYFAPVRTQLHFSSWLFAPLFLVGLLTYLISAPLGRLHTALRRAGSGRERHLANQY